MQRSQVLNQVLDNQMRDFKRGADQHPSFPPGFRLDPPDLSPSFRHLSFKSFRFMRLEACRNEDGHNLTTGAFSTGPPLSACEKAADQHLSTTINPRIPPSATPRAAVTKCWSVWFRGISRVERWLEILRDQMAVRGYSGCTGANSILTPKT
jgi:hypothetical protein